MHPSTVIERPFLKALTSEMKAGRRFNAVLVTDISASFESWSVILRASTSVMRCSVLRSRMCLCVCYALSGTELAYVPMRLPCTV
eukprot:2768056-Rhodomonas_salina.1